MSQNGNQIEKRLWAAADELRANSKLKSSEYSTPVLGLIFLLYADKKFTAAEAELAGKSTARRKIGPADYQAKGVLYLTEEARFSHLLHLPEGANLGKAINAAMKSIEESNPDLKDILPKNYNQLENATLAELLKLMNSIPMDIEGDAFGKIYEYFLGEFAKQEGSKGGEFFTPICIVKLIVSIIEPFHGLIYDPACGSGGMFVQSARFVAEHQKNPDSEISIYGQEKTGETVRLAKMNLAVHGLGGDIREGNTYYEDLHKSTEEGGKFDFVMANPPFNVDRVNKERLDKDPRFPFGLPKADNANYIWIQFFYSALSAKGRSGFVMANSASDARGSELEIRKKLIEDRAVDVVVSVGPNFFYTVTLPCALWFMDKAKAKIPPCPPSPQPSPKGRGGYIFQGLVEQARQLRKKQTPAEDALWELLRNRQFSGFKFRRQHQIGDYIADFFCAEHGLIVELDGVVHGTAARQKVDNKRDAYLRSLGNTVHRFPNARVFDDTENLLNEILSNLPPPASVQMNHPSTYGRGAGGEGLTEDVLAASGPRTRDTVLFIDARHIFRQIDRAHREWTPDQIEFLANIVRLYRGEKPENLHESAGLLKENFPKGKYEDIPGLCKVATIKEIEAQMLSLNPGRYVGVAPGAEVSDEDFRERLIVFNEELEILNAQGRKLEETIANNVLKILEK